MTFSIEVDNQPTAVQGLTGQRIYNFQNISQRRIYFAQRATAPGRDETDLVHVLMPFRSFVFIADIDELFVWTSRPGTTATLAATLNES